MPASAQSHSQSRTRRRLRRIAVLPLLAVASMMAIPAGASAAALPPPNDAFSAATRITHLPFADVGVGNWAATLGGAEIGPYCSSIAATVWYRIDPTSNYTVGIRVLPQTDMNAVVAVYERNPQSTLLNIACSDDGGVGYKERVDVSLVSGKTYFIQVGGAAYDSPHGDFTVKVKRLPPPSNDAFENASEVVPGNVRRLNTRAATIQDDEPLSSCGWGIGNTVWYRYTPDTTHQAVAQTIGSSFDTIINVFQGTSLESLNGIICNDDRGVDVASRVEFTVAAGETYFFQVGGYGGSSGDLIFRLKST
jgi:hypothetical protein